jgi:hypothetical protein
MRISTTIGYADGFRDSVAAVVDYERAGLDAVWVPEAYGFDSPSRMGYLAAVTDSIEIGSNILPTYTRTPALIAMTAAGLDDLSDGRFRLGLGSSGPQVVEGFHGVPYAAPLARTRENDRHLPGGLGARSPACPRRRRLHAATAGRRRDRTWQAAEDDQPRAPGADPHLGCLAG